MWSVCLIWIQSLNAPFIQFSTFLLVLPGCVHSDTLFLFCPTCTIWLLTKLRSVSTHKNTLGVHNSHGLSPYFGQFVFQDLYTAQLPLPLPLLPLSPADCRFYHIWSFTAPCLTAFQDHFLPALLLAASCSVGTHVNSGIGRNMKSGQDERTGLKSDVVSVTDSLTVSKCHVKIITLMLSA